MNAHAANPLPSLLHEHVLKRDSHMRKALYILCVVLSVFLHIRVLAAGIPYIYEKIDGSEFYTYTKEPAEGMIEFSETVFPPFGQYIVEVFMRNGSNRTLTFEKARYVARTLDGKIHYIELQEVEANSGGQGSLVLKPDNIMILYGKSPIRNDDVTDILIELEDGNRIHFVPYKRLKEFVSSPEQHLKNLLSGLMDIFRFRVPQGRG
jgi:hypothetical protein